MVTVVDNEARGLDLGASVILSSGSTGPSRSSCRKAPGRSVFHYHGRQSVPFAYVADRQGGPQDSPNKVPD